MGTKFKVFVCVLLLIAVVAAMGFAQENMGKSAIPAYLLAGFLGFGTGHLYSQVKWVPWLIADVVTLGVGIVGSVIAVASAASAITSTSTALLTGDTSGVSTGVGGYLIGSIIAVIGYGAYGIIRLIEFINIFKIVREQKEAGVLAQWTPTFEVLPQGIAAGLKYSY